ncbi:MAG: HAD family hydrolase [Candidatus Heimdallarchaeota archaeon]
MTPRTPLFGKIKVLFFDLDGTLHDNSKGMAIALRKVYHQFRDRLVPVTEAEFLEVHRKLVAKLIKEYREGTLQVAVPWDPHYRVRQMLQLLKIRNHSLVVELADTFVRLRKDCVQIFPGVKRGLYRLKKQYQLAILSNGPSDLQRNKLRWLGLYEIFDWILISEEIGYNKPDLRIFRYALRATRMKPEEGVMIGDTVEADLAAKKIGMKTILFDPAKKYVTHEFGEFAPDAIVSNFSDIQKILIK